MEVNSLIPTAPATALATAPATQNALALPAIQTTNLPKATRTTIKLSDPAINTMLGSLCTTVSYPNKFEF
jgi:hypothetical protein